MGMRFSGMGSKVALVSMGAVLLSGCSSWFDPDRWHGQDPDAARRAADPYGNDPRWSNPDTYSDYRNRPNGGAPNSLLDTIFSPGKPDASGGGGGSGIARQQLPLACLARHRVVHAARFGRSFRRHHHHRLVQPVRQPE